MEKIVVATNILDSAEFLSTRSVWYAPAYVRRIIFCNWNELSQPYALAAARFSGVFPGVVAGLSGFLSAGLLHSGDCSGVSRPDFECGGGGVFDAGLPAAWSADLWGDGG